MGCVGTPEVRARTQLAAEGTDLHQAVRGGPDFGNLYLLADTAAQVAITPAIAYAIAPVDVYVDFSDQRLQGDEMYRMYSRLRLPRREKIPIRKRRQEIQKKRSRRASPLESDNTATLSYSSGSSGKLSRSMESSVSCETVQGEEPQPEPIQLVPVHPQIPAVLPAVPNISISYSLGISFYRRVGRWTAHLWEGKTQAKKGKQSYIGSYASASEAMRGYDLASLKVFGDAAKLNRKRTDYLQDIIEMNSMTTENYKKLLQERSKKSKHRAVAPGVTKCPEGWYEVRTKGKVSNKVKWRFWDIFDNIEDARRCYQRALSDGKK